MIDNKCKANSNLSQRYKYDIYKVEFPICIYKSHVYKKSIHIKKDAL